MKTTTMIIVPKEACAVADNNFKKCAPACRANLGDLCPQKLVVFFFRCMFENHEKQKKTRKEKQNVYLSVCESVAGTTRYRYYIL